MQMQTNGLRKLLLRWLLPVTACLGVVLLLAGCSAEEAIPSATIQDMPESTRQALQQLNVSSEKLYQSMKADDPVQARAYLESIARQFPALSLEGTISTEGMEAVYVALGEARKTFNAARIDPHKALREAAKIRLLFDALSQPKHPMWKSYYKPMEENAKAMLQAAEDQNGQELQAAYEELAGRYAMIKPSLSVSRPAQLLVKADSMLVFLQTHAERDTPAYTQIQAVRKELLQLLRELFDRGASSTDAPVYAPGLPINPVLYWGAAIGSFIIAILAFVGYRRYQYEKARPPRIRPKRDREG